MQFEVNQPHNLGEAFIVAIMWSWWPPWFPMQVPNIFHKLERTCLKGASYTIRVQLPLQF